MGGQTTTNNGKDVIGGIVSIYYLHNGSCCTFSKTRQYAWSGGYN